MPAALAIPAYASHTLSRRRRLAAAGAGGLIRKPGARKLLSGRLKKTRRQRRNALRLAPALLRGAGCLSTACGGSVPGCALACDTAWRQNAACQRMRLAAAGGWRRAGGGRRISSRTWHRRACGKSIALTRRRAAAARYLLHGTAALRGAARARVCFVSRLAAAWYRGGCVCCACCCAAACRRSLLYRALARCLSSPSFAAVATVAERAEKERGAMVT